MYLFFLRFIDVKDATRCIRSVFVFGLITVLSACGSFSKNKSPVLSCPKVFLLQNANHMTVFLAGKSGDITDILANITLVSFKGECVFNKNRTEARFSLDVVFDISRGPANRTRFVKFRYFVAIPKFFPVPNGKKVFPINVKFQGNKTRVKLLDQVLIKVPIAQNYKLEDYSIYIGIQLTQKQLDYNQTQTYRRLRR